MARLIHNSYPAPLIEGFFMQSISNQVFESVVQYDAYDNPNTPCGINTTVNAGETARISITVDADLEPNPRLLPN
jgi:hypothetical protein